MRRLSTARMKPQDIARQVVEHYMLRAGASLMLDYREHERWLENRIAAEIRRAAKRRAS